MNTRISSRAVAATLLGVVVLAGGCRDEMPSGVKSTGQIGQGTNIVGSVVQTTELFREDGSSLAMPTTSTRVSAEWNGGRAMAAVGKVPLALGVTAGRSLAPAGIRAFVGVDVRGKRSELREYREEAGGPVARSIFYADGQPVLAIDAKWHRTTTGWELERQTIESYFGGRRTNRITYAVRSKTVRAGSAIEASPLLTSASFSRTILSRPATLNCEDDGGVWNRASTTTASGGAPSFACYEDGSGGEKGCLVEGAKLTAAGLAVGLAGALLAGAVAGWPVTLGMTTPALAVAVVGYGTAVAAFLDADEKYRRCRSPNE